MDFAVPPLGDVAEVAVIEVYIREGDQLELDQPVVTLETDKATMDVPATLSGTVERVHVAVGDHVSSGDLLLTVTSPTDASPDVPIPGGPAAHVSGAPAHQAGYGTTGIDQGTAADHAGAAGSASPKGPVPTADIHAQCSSWGRARAVTRPPFGPPTSAGRWCSSSASPALAGCA